MKLKEKGYLIVKDLSKEFGDPHEWEPDISDPGILYLQSVRRKNYWDGICIAVSYLRWKMEKKEFT